MLAVYCFWRRQATELKAGVWRNLTILACVLVAVHLFAMGYEDWLKVQKWNGDLPPTTLLSFLMVVSSLAVFIRLSEKHEEFFADSGRVLASKIGSL